MEVDVVMSGTLQDVQSSSQITTTDIPTLSFLHADCCSFRLINSVEALRDVSAVVNSR